MSDLRRRHSDERDSEAWKERNETTELRLGWGQKSIQARGLGAVIVILAFLFIAIEWYLADAQAKEHRILGHNQVLLIEALDVQNWLLSMPQDKRPKLKRPVGADRYLLNGGEQ
jgi:hypothetical protein